MILDLFYLISSPRGAMKAYNNNNNNNMFSLILFYFEPQGCHESLWKHLIFNDSIAFHAPGAPWKLIKVMIFPLILLYFKPQGRGAMTAYKNNDFSLILSYFEPQGFHESS